LRKSCKVASLPARGGPKQRLKHFLQVDPLEYNNYHRLWGATVRLNRQLVGLALGLLLSLLLERFMWKVKLPLYGTFLLVLYLAPLVFGVFSALRLRLSSPSPRWTEDSVSYKRFKRLLPLRLVASGMTAVVSLGIFLFLLIWGVTFWNHSARHLWEGPLWTILFYSSAAYGIWRRYCENRKPLAAFSSGNPKQPRSIYRRLESWEERRWRPRGDQSLLDGNSRDFISLHLTDVIQLTQLGSDVGKSAPNLPTKSS
jgi:hypothetical protein